MWLMLWWLNIVVEWECDINSEAKGLVAGHGLIAYMVVVLVTKGAQQEPQKLDLYKSNFFGLIQGLGKSSFGLVWFGE